MLPLAVREARPFPFERLPKITRSEAAVLRRCARSLPLGALARIAARSAEWLGAPFELEPLPIERSAPGSLPGALADPICAAILEPASALPRARIALELEPRFAALLVDRVLGGAGEDVPPHPPALGEVERGVLAYALARVLAESAPGALRLSAIVTSPTALALALDPGPMACWPGRARIGGDVGIVRVWLPESALDRAVASSTPGPHAAALGGLSLPMRLEAGRASLAAAELASLAPGDVVVLDHAPARACEGALRGEVVLRARGGATEWRCAIEGDRFVVRAVEPGRPAARAPQRGPTMKGEDKDEERAAQLLRVAGDAPVELVVELARFEMPLAELAALRPGEVLATGRSIGERVVLRAGDRAVAEGELVEIDGEIGVRLISLAHS